MAAAASREDDAGLRRAHVSSEWRIIPILSCLWLLAWVDRANISFAKLQMLTDLHFGEAVYGFGAGLFFLGYVAFGIPAILLQQKLGARRIIASIAVGWGATSVAMVFASYPIAFYLLRFLLGAFEAGFYPESFSISRLGSPPDAAPGISASFIRLQFVRRSWSV